MKVIYLLLLLSFTLIICAPVEITIDEAKKILEDTGLMSGKKVSELSSKELEDALKQMQETYQLPITGKLDKDTTEFLSQPRCGQHSKKGERKIIASNPWKKSEITYKLNNYPRNGLDKSKTIKAVTKAFETWSTKIPVKFTLKEKGETDMELEFESAEDGDGPSKTIAYAYPPPDGGIFYDAENWTIDYNEVGIDLFLTSTHEIGHSLGLEHSTLPESIMFPFIQRYKPGFQLHYTDVNEIQKLYGTTCLTESIDAILAPNSTLLYVIKGNQCWKYINRTLQNGYPKPLRIKWPGLDVEFVDAAYHYDNSYYFISDKTVYIYNYNNNTIKQEKLKKSFGKIDAAVTLGHRIYYFADSSYSKYTKTGESMAIEKSFPRQMSTFWLGVPSNLDAAYTDDEINFYFFKGDTVYSFHLIDKHKVATSQKISAFLHCT